MIFWMLYLSIDGQFNIDYPYHFAMKETCVEVGKQMVKEHKYANYRCIKEVRE